MAPEKTWPIAVRYYPRGRAVRMLPFDAYWDTYGFAVRDSDGVEHHFGLSEDDGGRRVFTFFASYDESGRVAAWPGGVDSSLAAGFELVEPTVGPCLSPLVVGALDELAEFAAHKGFAFDEERKHAVQTLGALVHAGERFDPEEVYVHAATSGYRLDDARKLREYAERANNGRGTRTVSGRTIRVDRQRAERMVERWRSQIEA